MDFLKSKPRRSHITEAAYAALNVALAIIILFVVLSFESMWLPLALVLLSKWRVLAVRPRFWRANILANLVDIIVGLSYVVIIHEASGVVVFQVVMTLLYIGWLLFIKPRSKRSFVVAQALIAQFLGINALAMVAYATDIFVFVAGMWVIGFAAARHILVHYSEALTTFLSLAVALVTAELGWLGYHWLFSYGFTGTDTLLVSQLAIISTLMLFMAERMYAVYRTNKDARPQDITLPVVFSVSVILLMIFFFNNISPTGSL